MSCLFEAVERSVELENRVCTKTIAEAIRSVHVHLMVEFSIEKRIANV